MRKKISLMGILICAMFILGIGSANAEARDVSWQDVQNSFQKVLGQAYTVTTTTDSMTVSIPEDNYSITFKNINENGNVVFYSDNFNMNDAGTPVAKVADGQKDLYYKHDKYFINKMIDVLCDAYHISLNSWNTIKPNNLEDFGVYIEDKQNDKLIVGRFDLNLFSNATCDSHNTLIDLNTYVVKKAPTPAPAKENPKCKVENGKYYDANGKEVNKDAYNKACKKTVANPKTGLSLPVAGGFIVIILAASFYLALTKQNKFKHI